jgi:hypothetical protein
VEAVGWAEALAAGSAAERAEESVMAEVSAEAAGWVEEAEAASVAAEAPGAALVAVPEEASVTAAALDAALVWAAAAASASASAWAWASGWARGQAAAPVRVLAVAGVDEPSTDGKKAVHGCMPACGLRDGPGCGSFSFQTETCACRLRRG